MKNTIMLFSLIFLFSCKKETTQTPTRPTYTWQIGEANSIYSLKINAQSNEKYTLAIVNEDLCGNKNVHFSIIQNTRVIEEKDLNELIYTKILDIKTNDIIEINATLIDVKKDVQCKKMGNVKFNLK